jgi:outer membrane protein OmpA-like peptidoglycan-associated protein
MTCKSVIRNALTILMVGSLGFMAAGPVAAHAQELQLLGASPAAQETGAETTPGQRLILHDVTLRGSSLSIEPDSRPVLDYAVQLLRENPTTLIYVSGQGEPAAVQRQAKAVARYLRHHGVAANRVVLETSIASASQTANGSDANGVVVLNLGAPSCASCPS